MKILITGGAGFIGSHLTDLMLDAGHTVTAFDNFATGTARNLAHRLSDDNLHLITGDILDPASLSKPVADADLIYHLAAAVGVQYVINNPVSTLDTNSHGTANVLRSAREEGGKKVIIASSSEVYGRSPNLPYSEEDVLSIGPSSVPRWGYACSKLLDEFLALAHWKEAALPVVILRLFNTVGPRQSGSYGMVLPRMVNQCMAGEPVTIYGDGTQTRCFAYVGDVVRAMVQIADVPEAEGQVFNLGSDTETTINDLAELVRDTLRSSSSFQHIQFESVYGSDFEDIPRRIPDLHKIKRYIDYNPVTVLTQVISEIADEFRRGESMESKSRLS